MSEPRRWTLWEHACACGKCDERRSGVDGSPVRDERVEVIEAAPVEAELERLRKIEAAARNVLTFLPLDGGFDELVALREALEP
jgi:hypothetical protein